MRTSVAIALSLLVLGSTTAEESGKTWKLKLPGKPAPGVKFQETREITSDGYSKITEEGKAAREGPIAFNSSYDYTTEITAVDGDGPTSLKWTFKKARGSKAGRETTFAFEGKTVIGKRGEDKKWAFVYEDGSGLGEAEADLSQFVPNSWDNFAEVLFPNSSVRVGDSWTLEPRAVLKQLGFPEDYFDLKTSKGACKLVSVEDQGGASYALISYEISLVSRFVPPVKLDEAFPTLFKGDVKFCADGALPNVEKTFIIEIVAKGHGVDRSNDKSISVDLDMRNTIREKSTRAAVK